MGWILLVVLKSTGMSAVRQRFVITITERNGDRSGAGFMLQANGTEVRLALLGCRSVALLAWVDASWWCPSESLVIDQHCRDLAYGASTRLN